MNRRFFAYLCAAAAADSGSWIAQVAQGWLVVKLTDSPLRLGIVSAATQLPFLLFSPAGGALADRFDRRRIIAINNLATAVEHPVCLSCDRDRWANFPTKSQWGRHGTHRGSSAGHDPKFPVHSQRHIGYKIVQQRTG
jgi:hypothetical protein